MIDLAGIEAKREAMIKIVKKMDADKDAENAENPLKQMFEIQEKRFQRIQAMEKSGSVSDEDVTQAKLALLSARLKWNESKAKTNGTPTFKTELLELSLDRAEKKARLEKTESLMANISKARKTLSGMTNVVSERDRMADRAKRMRYDIEEKESDLRKTHEELKKLIQSDNH